MIALDKQKEIKVDIENGPVFFADEAGVMHNPLKIILDFRSVTPRVDIRNRDFQPLVIKHNVVMMDVYTAKNFLNVFKDNIKNYEKKYGNIKKPEALSVMEKDAKKSKSKKTKKTMPNYFG
ncbi:DUF3467 domain-containing protein [Candidatus Woesearchaeota archaeon]|nr:DUF3467 domain-containing protein [Candidatus Woesearchaeota archaeon]